MAARRACRYRSRANDHEKRAESTDVEHGKVRYRSRVRLSRDDPDRMAGMRDDCRIASRGVGRHLCADRDSRPSSLRASARIRGADCHHGHDVRMVMGQRRCTFRPARVPERRFLEGTTPYWLAGLWALFAIQLNTLLHWLRARPLVSALVGAFAGPASFRAGAALGPFISPIRLQRSPFSQPAGRSSCQTALAIASHWDGVTPPSPPPIGAGDMNDARAG